MRGVSNSVGRESQPPLFHLYVSLTAVCNCEYHTIFIARSCFNVRTHHITLYLSDVPMPSVLHQWHIALLSPSPPLSLILLFRHRCRRRRHRGCALLSLASHFSFEQRFLLIAFLVYNHFAGDGFQAHCGNCSVFRCSRELRGIQTYTREANAKPPRDVSIFTSLAPGLSVVPTSIVRSVLSSYRSAKIAMFRRGFSRAADNLDVQATGGAPNLTAARLRIGTTTLYPRLGHYRC